MTPEKNLHAGGMEVYHGGTGEGRNGPLLSSDEFQSQRELCGGTESLGRFVGGVLPQCETWPWEILHTGCSMSQPQLCENVPCLLNTSAVPGSELHS